MGNVSLQVLTHTQDTAVCLHVQFGVFSAVFMKLKSFLASCFSVNTCRLFGRVCCVHILALNTENLIGLFVNQQSVMHQRQIFFFPLYLALFKIYVHLNQSVHFCW